jgi:hypothetical protein
MPFAELTRVHWTAVGISQHAGIKHTAALKHQPNVKQLPRYQSATSLLEMA